MSYKIGDPVPRFTEKDQLNMLLSYGYKHKTLAECAHDKLNNRGAWGWRTRGLIAFAFRDEEVDDLCLKQ